MRDFGKNASVNNSTAVNAQASAGTTLSTGTKIRPKFDICTKPLKEDGSVDVKADLVKLAGLFENISKDGKTYYSGASKEQGAKFYLYPVTKGAAIEGSDDFDICMKPLGADGKVDKGQKMIKLAALKGIASKEGNIYHSGISKEQGVQFILYPVRNRTQAAAQ